MVRSCAAIGCTQRQGAVNEDGSVVAFHQLPKDKSRRLAWLVALKRKDLLDRKETLNPSCYHVCSQHFYPEDYVQFGERRNLKENSQPSPFELPKPLTSKVPSKRKAPKDRECPTSATVLKVSHPNTNLGSGPAVPEHGYCRDVQGILENVTERENHLKNVIRKVRYERKCLRQALKRRDKRLTSLSSTIQTLQHKRYISEDMAEVLKAKFSNKIVASIFQNEVVNSHRGKQGRRYSDDIKRFCLTLHYYSPRAYAFLADNFHLPGKTTLKQWTKSVDCEVGILTEVTSKLKELVEMGKIDQNCSLIMDEMSIRKGLIYNHSDEKFVGHVDLGSGSLEDGALATNALMFMAVGLKGEWRHPVAYFLTSHITSDTLTELTTSVLSELADAGLKVKVMVADGLKANLTMFCRLGAKLDNKSLQLPAECYFKHPTTGEKVHVLLDVVHMLKLLRNLLGDQKTIKLDNEEISWTHIQALYDLQHQEGVRAANKLTRRHIEYSQNKMKVKLAAQVFSSSVGKALLYLVQSGHPQFKEAGPTARFILLVDRAFDYMNGCSPFGKGYKAPITERNLRFREAHLAEFAATMHRLTTTTGQPILRTQRYTPILGLCVAATTIPAVARDLLSKANYKYVLPYRMSQDHLELHFGRIRRMGGFNNNPNAWQLRQAMRRLVLHNFVTPSFAGNCTPREEADDGLLVIHRPMKKDRRGDGCGIPGIVEHILQSSTPSAFLQNCTAYIAGYVCKKVVDERRVQCGKCVGAMLASDNDPPPSDATELIKVRDNGGLLMPSGSVYRVVLCAEQHLSSFQKCMDVTRETNLSQRIQCSVSQHMALETTRRLFPGVEDHMFQAPGDENHFSWLVKVVVGRYVRVRLYDFGKVRTQAINSSVHKRHRLTKAILFGNQ